MSMKNHPLEMYVADRLSKILNEKCRPTKASGASTEIMDVYNSMFFVECKMTKKTDDFIIKTNELDKAYSQASKVLGSEKKVLFVMQNKSNDRIAIMHYIDLMDLMGEVNFDKYLAKKYIHFHLMKKQFTLYKEDLDYYYFELQSQGKEKTPAIVFHDRGLQLYVILDLEDFFYLLEKYILKGEDEE